MQTNEQPGNELVKQQDDPIKEFFAHPSVMKKFNDLLGTKGQGFITSVLQIVGGSNELKACLPKTIFNAAATAATMDLPINQNLGFAWIIPYKGSAQFQMGYKGFVQLAMRTGQYLRLNAIPVYKNQFTSWNELTEELVADFNLPGEGEVVGYCGYFKLLNGFEKTTFWTKAKVLAHSVKYSKDKRDNSIWKTDFESMALKTVLKMLLSKWGILSIEMQKAITLDQSVIHDPDGNSWTYVDNEEEGTEGKRKSDKALDQTMQTLNDKLKKRNNGNNQQQQQ